MSRVGPRSLPRAAAIGFSAGLRTFPPLAALRLRDRAFRRRAGLVILPAAIGELVADKLPNAPSRLTPPALAARAISGALAGAAVTRSRRTGALLGAAAALAGATAGVRARMTLGNTSGPPDFAIAIIEDVTAALIAGFATSPRDRRARRANTESASPGPQLTFVRIRAVLVAVSSHVIVASTTGPSAARRERPGVSGCGRR